MSMKNSNDTIGNRTRDLPSCSSVPHQTAPPVVVVVIVLVVVVAAAVVYIFSVVFDTHLFFNKLKVLHNWPSGPNV